MRWTVTKLCRDPEYVQAWDDVRGARYFKADELERAPAEGVENQGRCPRFLCVLPPGHDEPCEQMTRPEVQAAVARIRVENK